MNINVGPSVVNMLCNTGVSETVLQTYTIIQEQTIDHCYYTYMHTDNTVFFTLASWFTKCADG